MVAVLQPIKPGKLITIDRAVVLVGRGSDCDAIISNSQKISRRHCCLVQVDNLYYLRDLGSMNGVWLNGTRVSREALIKSGDRISIGDVEFLFHPNAKIEQKKTSAADATGCAPSPDPVSAAVSQNGSDVIADAVAEPPSAIDDDDKTGLIDSGMIEIVDDVKIVDEGFEVIDDVVLLDDDDAYLVETNEVEIVDEPIVEPEDFEDDDILPSE